MLGGAERYRPRRLAILGDRARHEIVDRHHVGDARCRMPPAPDIAPALRAVLARADVDVLADVDGAACRQVVGIEAGGRRSTACSMLVCRPVKAVVSRMSSALLSTSICLWRSSAMLSRVAMNFVPM